MQRWEWETTHSSTGINLGGYLCSEKIKWIIDMCSAIMRRSVDGRNGVIPVMRRHSRMWWRFKYYSCALKPIWYPLWANKLQRKEKNQRRNVLTVTTVMRATNQSLSILTDTGCSRWTRIATATTHTTGWTCLLKMKWRWRTRSQSRRRSNTWRWYGTINQYLRLCLTWEITRPSDPWRRRSPRISVCAWQFFGWDWICEWGLWCWCRCWGSGW